MWMWTVPDMGCRTMSSQNRVPEVRVGAFSQPRHCYLLNGAVQLSRLQAVATSAKHHFRQPIAPSVGMMSRGIRKNKDKGFECRDGKRPFSRFCPNVPTSVVSHRPSPSRTKRCRSETLLGLSPLLINSADFALLS